MLNRVHRHALFVSQVRSRVRLYGLVVGRRMICSIDIKIHFVDLLESQSLGLVDEKIGPEDGDKAEGRPDEKYFGAQIGIAGARVDHVWSGEGEGPVEEPGRRGREGHAPGSDMEREDFGSDDPRTPVYRQSV